MPPAAARVLATGRPRFEDGPLDGSLPDAKPRSALLPFSFARGRHGLLAVTRRPNVPWSESAQVRAIAFASLVADALDRTEQAAIDRQVALTLQRALIPEEIVTPNEDALMVDPTAPAIADGVLRLLDDPVLGKRLAQAGYRNMHANFDVNVMLDAYGRLYEAAR